MSNLEDVELISHSSTSSGELVTHPSESEKVDTSVSSALDAASSFEATNIDSSLPAAAGQFLVDFILMSK